MKKQVIVYVDVPDDAPEESRGGESINTIIESYVEDQLPDSIYVEVPENEAETDEVEVLLQWGGVTCRDAS